MKIKSKKKLIYIFTGKRGGFSHFIPIIHEIEKKKIFNYKIVVSDMHLSKKFGSTIKEIKFYTTKIIKLKPKNIEDNIQNRLSVISNNIESLSKLFSKKKPDFFLVLGDRAEVLGAVIAAQFFNIPIIHMYGGDITQGGTDEPTRHAITKLSNLHLTSNSLSAKLVKQMGESKWRVKNVGLTSIDLLKENYLRSKLYLKRKYKINFSKPYVILIQHPVTWEVSQSKFQITQTLKAIKLLNIQTLAIYPCSDPGFKNIIKSYKDFQKYKFFKLFKNIEIVDFYSLLHYSSFLMGNSSCGITESGYLKKYVINIGIRQQDRLTGRNVFNVPHDYKKILILMKKILKKKKIKNKTFIYGNGNSARKIIKVIMEKFSKEKLIRKKFEKIK